MKRRAFLAKSAIGTAGMSIAAGCSKSTGFQTIPAAKESQLAMASFELEEITVEELQTGMESGKYSAESVVQAYLNRIDKIDRGENGVNSIIELNPDALSIARDLDKERAAGKIRGPLHGIPIVIKDNIDTFDKMRTTAGSLALMENYAKRDAGIVEKLRDAGAIILAKTNLSEWANFRGANSSSGWSGRGGQTNNPYVLSRNPCGSSSGSGAAVSANFAALAIGTETNGSVVCPSSANGVVGIKPSIGLVGRSGIIPIAHTQDTAGPMARTVTDAVKLLNVMVGVDDRDDVTQDGKRFEKVDYTTFLDADGLKGARIGIVRNFLGFDKKVDEIMESAFSLMEDAGATIVDKANIETSSEIGSAGYDVLLYEFKHDIAAYLATCPDGVPHKTLADLAEFNRQNADKEMPYFGQERFEDALAKGDLNDPEYKEALEKMLRLSGPEGIDKTLEDHNVDVLVAATGGPAWKTDWVRGDHFGGGSSSPAARAGYANITVPAGFVHGLPVGMSIFAGKYEEGKIIKVAYAFEQLSKVRKAPTFRKKD